MDTDLAASLQSHFGFTGFRPGQREAVQSLLDGRHTLVVMPTGSGKSLVFQLAALHLPGITVVISPLVALMKDQVDSLESRGIPAAFINSSLTASEQAHRLRKLSGGCYRLVYVAPERLRSLQFLEALRQQPISLLAVDEAHCISEWGHDFRPDYLQIAKFRYSLDNPLTAALTATATPQVQQDITRRLGLEQARRIVTGFNRPNLTFMVQTITSFEARLQALQEQLIPNPKEGAIVYTGTRRDAEEVADFILEGLKIPTRYYHAGLMPEQRSAIQDAFMQGKLPIVVATNAFGMGIDRADVRQVVHFSLPGSLEAYYQEAGRAGRDGKPASAVLLYSPEDRALQEWFIENGIPSAQELRQLYDALRPASDSHRTVTIDELSCLTSLPQVKVRLALAELERAQMLAHPGDEGLQMHLRLQSWNDREARAIIERLKGHQAKRRKQLAGMIAYAESNDCRRKIILQHFGDPGPSEAAECCDNCQMRHTAENTRNADGGLSQSERMALIILDTVRRQKPGVGTSKIAKILKGSKAKDILGFGYDKNIYYGRLVVLRGDEIKGLIEQLLKMRYLKVTGSEYPVLRLTPLGEAAVKQHLAIPIQFDRKVSVEAARHKRAGRQAGGTFDYTLELLSEGRSVEQVARQRELAIHTIYGHAARLIAAGKILLQSVVPPEVQQQVEAAISQAGAPEPLYPIKILLPEEIDYNVIRCVVEHWKREHPSDDPVRSYLAHTHPRPLQGPWPSGWALGFHSRYSGADWKRSETGELAYRLKYQNDLSVLPALLDQTMGVLAAHPELRQVDAILPVPPTLSRPVDPVSSFASALAQRLGLACLPVLAKVRHTAPQKEMQTLAQKRANVAGAFALKTPVKGKRLLVIDDLFDSGATLEEIYRLLERSGAAKICVLTLSRTIHTEN